VVVAAVAVAETVAATGAVVAAGGGAASELVQTGAYPAIRTDGAAGGEAGSQKHRDAAVDWQVGNVRAVGARRQGGCRKDGQLLWGIRWDGAQDKAGRKHLAGVGHIQLVVARQEGHGYNVPLVALGTLLVVQARGDAAQVGVSGPTTYVPVVPLSRSLDLAPFHGLFQSVPSLG